MINPETKAWAAKYAIDNRMKMPGGKFYLEVKHRLVMFHKLYPDWSVQTEIVELRDDRAVVMAELKDGECIRRSTGIKDVRWNGQGKTKDNPFSTAETGAIGRALNVIGIGTLYGDIEEGEELSDAPTNPAKGQPSIAKRWK